MKYSLIDHLCPLFLLKRRNANIKHIDEYIRTKLSLENLLKNVEDVERLKICLLDEDEFYFFNLLDRFVAKKILKIEEYKPEKFKLCYEKIKSSNSKLIRILEF